MKKRRKSSKTFFEEFKEFFVASGETKKNWVGFLLLGVAVLLLDITVKHVYRFYLYDMALPFFDRFLMGIRSVLRGSFVEIFLSQISITFLVTSLLSIFGSNEKYIYWENAISYKLIEPKGRSFRDITAYCLGTLPLSVLAMTCRFYLLFVVSFAVNIIGLTIITARMFTIYFCDETIREELKAAFQKMSAKEQEDKILQLEANTYRHIQNFELDAILKNTKFLCAFAKQQQTCNPALFLSLLRIYAALPQSFSYVKPEINQALFHATGMITAQDSDLIPPDAVMQDNIRKIVCGELQPLAKAEQLEKIREDVFVVVREQIYQQGVTESIKKQMLHLYEILMVQIPLNRLLNYVGSENVPLKNREIDFGEVFSDFVGFIKAAYDGKQDLTPYIYSLDRMYGYIYESALGTLEENGMDPVSRAKEMLSVDKWQELPESFSDVIKVFDDESALSLFEMLCDSRAVYTDKRGELSRLRDVYSASLRMSDETKEAILTIVDNSKLKFKEELSRYIRSA